MAPQLLAWDETRQILLLEDLGERSLATTLLGSDRAAAQAALLACATALGRLHAATAGDETPAACLALPGNARALPRDTANFRQLCTAAGVAVAAGFDADIAAIETTLNTPGSFRALTHGDPCPGNERLLGSDARLFDFEAAGYDHALLDAAYLTMAFPTCWCVGTIPAETLAAALGAYRQALAQHVTAAADDTLFFRHLLHASARWLLTGDAIVPRAQRTDGSQLQQLLKTDWPWGPATARQRLLHRLQTFIRCAESTDALPSLRTTAARLRVALIDRWPDCPSNLPNYPAFQLPYTR